MSVKEILRNVRLIVDSNGNRGTVQQANPVWERELDLFEPVDDRDAIDRACHGREVHR